MAEKFASRRNIDFMINEVFDVASLNRFPYFEDHDEETFKMILDTALKISTEMMFPYFKEMDTNPPYWEDGKVHVYKKAIVPFLKEMGEGGWINAEKPYDIGGQQLPLTIKELAYFLFGAANYSMHVYPMLTAGAANLIYQFGSREMKDMYLPKMYSGEWQGTMALTEPDVGSSLGDLTTIAEPTDQGYYMIKGQKIFISAGNSDVVDNVIHLLIARLKDGPLGVPGISLFVVPEYRINENGGLEYNDVQCGGIEHKLGYKGSPIAQLTFGEEKNCRGWLVGDLGKGLAQMFKMMNEERINVGIGAVSKIAGAYYAALEYAQQRKQGRKPDQKDPATPMVELIEHADIKRMLLLQKAVMEGSMALAIQLSMYQDLVTVDENAEEHEMLTDFIIPMLKTYPSEMGILATSAAIQIHGGYGFCGDFPVEQYYRDIRIDPIHEGTTGIQGQDILGRKISMKNGKAFQLYINEVEKTIAEAKNYPELEKQIKALESAVQLMKDLTALLLAKKAQITNEAFLADAVLYLDFMSQIAIAWQWLKLMTAAAKALKGQASDQDKAFYQGKIYTGRYFYDYELTKIHSLAIRLSSDDKVTVEMASEYFED
ncbi:MAG TPA: acyl-CoA dehydrogenase [Syntrophomonas sp.]|jgi:alkylation response protein AidB-like acyl-CoA dehydrogenase|nr:acyl-CoA dehydrogenase [Syntrophomonas sp.]